MQHLPSAFLSLFFFLLCLCTIQANYYTYTVYPESTACNNGYMIVAKAIDGACVNYVISITLYGISANMINSTFFNVSLYGNGCGNGITKRGSGFTNGTCAAVTGDGYSILITYVADSSSSSSSSSASLTSTSNTSSHSTTATSSTFSTSSTLSTSTMTSTGNTTRSSTTTHQYVFFYYFLFFIFLTFRFKSYWRVNRGTKGWDSSGSNRRRGTIGRRSDCFLYYQEKTKPHRIYPTHSLGFNTFACIFACITIKE
jgi:hypothetical protein